MKILCIGDTHFKDNLSYADYIQDERRAENAAEGKLSGFFKKKEN